MEENKIHKNECSLDSANIHADGDTVNNNASDIDGKKTKGGNSTVNGYVHNTDFMPLSSVEVDKNRDNNYIVAFNSVFCYIAIAVLFGVLSAVLSLLTTNLVPSSDKGVLYVFFISVVVVAIVIKKFGLFGLITAVVSSTLFCVALKLSIRASIINISVNLLQAALIYLALLLIKKRFGDYDPPRDSKSSNDSFAMFQAVIGIAFTCCGLLVKEMSWILRAFAIVEVVLYIVYICCEGSKRKLIFFLCLSILPSMVSGAINGALLQGVSIANRMSSIEEWGFSNFVLLASFGYLFIESFNRINSKSKLRFGELTVKVTTILYYGASLLWNIFFYIIYCIGWLSANLLPYLLPWIVGNLFLLLNTYFDVYVENDEKEKSKAFQWYEQRAIVAEKNTQFLISIITFLLPISSSLFGKTLGTNIVTLFCINITCACLAIGLIWIPYKEVKAMSLIKSLKTIFHLLTVCFLLLTATVIIVS